MINESEKYKVKQEAEKKGSLKRRMTREEAIGLEIWRHGYDFDFPWTMWYSGKLPGEKD